MAEPKKKKLSRDEQIEGLRTTLETERLSRSKKDNEISNLPEVKRRQSFQEYWTSARRSFGRPERELEDILWAHLKAIKCDVPSKFEEGVAHFGLRKIN
jgi:hypothetical protein